MFRVTICLQHQYVGDGAALESLGDLTQMVRAAVCTTEVEKRALCPQGLAACAMRLSAENSPEGIVIGAECQSPACMDPLLFAARTCVSALLVPVQRYYGPNAVDQFLADNR